MDLGCDGCAHRARRVGLTPISAGGTGSRVTRLDATSRFDALCFSDAIAAVQRLGGRGV